MTKVINKNSCTTNRCTKSDSKQRENSVQRERIVSKLRQQGLRITKQRLIIIDIILGGECSCCKEIYYKASKIDNKIGNSTVYRMVNLLEEIGEINRGNIYKVESCKNCNAKKCYCVEFDDDTIVELSESSWRHIVQVGLSICGYSKDKKVVRVKIG